MSWQVSTNRPSVNRQPLAFDVPTLADLELTKVHNAIYPDYIWRQAFGFPEGFFEADNIVHAEFRRFASDASPLAFIEGGSGAVISKAETGGGEFSASRENIIAVVRTTRAELITAASAGGLIPGEPYLIMDEGSSPGPSTEFRATVMQDDLEGVTFFAQ